MKKWTRWQDWVALIAGVYAFLSPIWTDTDQTATWTMVVLGVVTAAVSLWSLAMPGDLISEYAHAVLGGRDADRMRSVRNLHRFAARNGTWSGAPDTIRTCDLCLRRATLYPAELRVQWGSFSRLGRDGQRPRPGWPRRTWQGSA